jgi:hypothetical protein
MISSLVVLAGGSLPTQVLDPPPDRPEVLHVSKEAKKTPAPVEWVWGKLLTPPF